MLSPKTKNKIDPNENEDLDFESRSGVSPDQTAVVSVRIDPSHLSLPPIQKPKRKSYKVEELQESLDHQQAQEETFLRKPSMNKAKTSADLKPVKVFKQSNSSGQMKKMARRTTVN